VLIIGNEMDDLPEFFRFPPDEPRLLAATLPADPWSIPPGTSQQILFDRLGGRRTAVSAPGAGSAAGPGR
jgi:hypothetical protein